MRQRKECCPGRGLGRDLARDWGTSGREAGFTLLEVLIAFVIAALAIGALFGGTAGGLSATAVAAKYDEAISLARSHLAAIGRGEGIKRQETNGVEGDGFSWKIRVRPVGTRQLSLTDQDRANDVKPTAATLYDVVVTESWKAGGRTRQVTLATKRFDTVEGEGGQ